MSEILLRNAAAVVSCDQTDRVYKNADILIKDRSIAEIGSRLQASADAEILDMTGKIIYPGLINTHHHFFQTFVRNLETIDYPNMTVMSWIDRIYRIFKEIDDDVIYYSSLTAMGDLLKHGCTCAFDHQYCYTEKTGKRPVDRQMEAAAKLGIRYHAGRGCNTLPRDKGGSIPEEMLETTDEFLKDCERLIDRYDDPNPFSMSRIVVSPCQPINCFRETFEESVRFARDKGVFLHTHLGEGENEGILQRYGMRTLDFCESVGFAGKDVFYAHCWELTPEEYRRAGKEGTGISHCPAPAVLGGYPIIDIADMKEAGVNVSLGCDGSATNDSSNLLDSMRMAYLMQSYYAKERGHGLSGYDVLKMATVNGAKTLGRTDLGSLEKGKAADLFSVDAGKIEYAGTLHDPKNLLARCGITGPADMTMVNGRIVYQDGHLCGIDEEKEAGNAEACCSKVLRSQFPEIWKNS